MVYKLRDDFGNVGFQSVSLEIIIIIRFLVVNWNQVFGLVAHQIRLRVRLTHEHSQCILLANSGT